MEKKKKKIIVGTLIGIGIGAVCIGTYKYLGYEINKEGSSLWFKYSSLEQKKKFREIIGKQYKDAGINNLSDEQFYFIERMKFKLDKTIGIIENAIFEKEHPSAHLPHREDGWYLLNKS